MFEPKNYQRETLEWLRRWDQTLEEPGVALAQFIDYMRNL